MWLFDCLPCFSSPILVHGVVRVQSTQVNNTLTVIQGVDLSKSWLRDVLPPELCVDHSGDDEANKSILRYLRDSRPSQAVTSTTADSKSSPSPSATLAQPTPNAIVVPATQVVSRIKCMFVGFGGVGKTTLVRAMSHLAASSSPGSADSKSASASSSSSSLSVPEATDGVDMTDIQFVPAASPPSSTPSPQVRLTCWDFAGQPVQYLTHRLFLSSGCLYLMVYNPRVNSVDQNEAHVMGWLEVISSADAQALVIVVATNIDTQGSANVVDQSRVRARFPSMSIHFHQTGANLQSRSFTGVTELMGRMVSLAQTEWKDQFSRVWCVLCVVCCWVSGSLMCVCW